MNKKVVAALLVAVLGVTGASIVAQFPANRVGLMLWDSGSSNSTALEEGSVAGSAKVDDADRDRDHWNVWQSIINFQMQSNAIAFMVDSSDAKPTYDMKRLGLVFYPQFDSLTTSVRVAVQVRAHYNTSSDSAAAFPWYRWPVRNTTVAADQDSVGHIVAGTSAPPWTSGTGAWSGEFVLVLNANRTPGSYGGYPKGIYVPLVDHAGGWYWAPYTSVRVRYLNGIKSRMLLRVDMVGGSL